VATNNPTTDLPALIASFLTVYLPVTRGCATNTVRSYRDVFILLLRFMESQHRIKANHLTYADLTAARILEFTTWLQSERGCSLSTANQRFTAIKSFMRYTQTKAPELIATTKPILEITVKKAPEPKLVYLSREAIEILMATAHHKGGLRDIALLATLYDSAARVQEIADLNHRDLHAAKPVTITVTGKGTKTRTIPLTANAGQIITRYAHANTHATPTDPLFTSRRGTRLTRAGIAAILARHTSTATIEHPTTIPNHVTPHALRHYVTRRVMWPVVVCVQVDGLWGPVSVT
jgi:site-specific recombinase XerD